MRKFLVLLCLLVSVKVFAVDPLQFQMVIPCDSMNAAQLYDVVNKWFAESYNNSQKVVQLRDESNKFITGKASLPIVVNSLQWSCLSGTIDYNIRVECRDKRIRVTMDMISQQCRPGCDPTWSMGTLYNVDINNMDDFYKQFNIKGLYKAKYKPFYKHALPLVKHEFASICESLVNYIAKKELKVEDNW